MATARQSWKGLERRLAQLFGTTRYSDGNLGADVPDVVTDKYSIEVKLRDHLPKWFTSMMKQASSNRVKDTMPLVILKKKHVPDMEAYVIIKLRDFMSIEGDKNASA